MMKQSIALLGAVLLVLVVATAAQQGQQQKKPAAGAGAAKAPPQAPGHQRARNENANGGTCDVDTFAESALYNFVDACWDMPYVCFPNDHTHARPPINSSPLAPTMANGCAHMNRHTQSWRG